MSTSLSVIDVWKQNHDYNAHHTIDTKYKKGKRWSLNLYIDNIEDAGLSEEGGHSLNARVLSCLYVL